ncbi:MAG: response regulator [Fuerstiella sp.]|jgi:CheY-like chemotaxis protein|nr:response regulator [Fuerstiella sp.]
MNHPVPSDTPAALHTRILLVEDTIDDQRLILKLLVNAGAEITLECNGQAGVERFLKAAQEGQQFDIIMMDMEMPVLDGVAATRQIRKLGFQKAIIAVTGHDSPALRSIWSAAGCDMFLAKPFTPKALIECVASFQREDTGTL